MLFNIVLSKLYGVNKLWHQTIYCVIDHTQVLSRVRTFSNAFPWCHTSCRVITSWQSHLFRTISSTCTVPLCTFFFFFRGKTVYVTELMLETLVWELFLQETHWIRGYFGRKNTAIFVTRKHGRSHEVINRGHGPPQHKHTQSHSLLIIADRSTWLPVVGQYNIFDIDIYNDYLYLAQDLTSYMQQSFCICAELHECFPSCELCFLKWAAAHPVCWKASVSKNIIHILWCF